MKLWKLNSKLNNKPFTSSFALDVLCLGDLDSKIGAIEVSEELVLPESIGFPVSLSVDKFQLLNEADSRPIWNKLREYSIQLLKDNMNKFPSNGNYDEYIQLLMKPEHHLDLIFFLVVEAPKFTNAIFVGELRQYTEKLCSFLKL